MTHRHAHKSCGAPACGECHRYDCCREGSYRRLALVGHPHSWQLPDSPHCIDRAVANRWLAGGYAWTDVAALPPRSGLIERGTLAVDEAGGAIGMGLVGRAVLVVQLPRRRW